MTLRARLLALILIIAGAKIARGQENGSTRNVHRWHYVTLTAISFTDSVIAGSENMRIVGRQYFGDGKTSKPPEYCDGLRMRPGKEHLIGAANVIFESEVPRDLKLDQQWTEEHNGHTYTYNVQSDAKIHQTTRGGEFQTYKIVASTRVGYFSEPYRNWEIYFAPGFGTVKVVGDGDHHECDLEYDSPAFHAELVDSPTTTDQLSRERSAPQLAQYVTVGFVYATTQPETGSSKPNFQGMDYRLGMPVGDAFIARLRLEYLKGKLFGTVVERYGVHADIVLVPVRSAGFLSIALGVGGASDNLNPRKHALFVVPTASVDYETPSVEHLSLAFSAGASTLRTVDAFRRIRQRPAAVFEAGITIR